MLKVTCFFIVWKPRGPIKWGNKWHLWCPHVSHFCNFRTGFNVHFLAVLRCSKVMVWFPLIFILPFSIFGPLLVQAVSRACTLLPSAPLYTRAFADYRDSVDPEEERTLPTAALTAPRHLSVQSRGAGHLPVRFKIWLFFRAATTQRNSNCRWVVLWAQLPRHG